MNIRKMFGFRKDRAMHQVDRLIYDNLSSTEQKEARREIASQFESLFDQMQDWSAEMEKMRADIQRDNELIVMLVKGES